MHNGFTKSVKKKVLSESEKVNVKGEHNYFCSSSDSPRV